MSEQTRALATYDPGEVDLIRKTVSDARNPLTQDEFALFLAVCQMTGLRPLERQIYPIKSGGKMFIHVGIDGHRKIAAESGFYAGQVGPQWMGDDGVWRDYWLAPIPPAVCRVGVLARGDSQPTWGVCTYKGYVVDTSPQWKKNPANQMAVRAEAQALRKRFPHSLGMVQLADPDDEPQTTARVEHAAQPALNGGDHADAEYTERAQDDQSGAVPASAGSQESAPSPAPVGLTPPPTQSPRDATANSHDQPNTQTARDEAVALYQACLAIGMKVTRPYIRSEDTPEAKDAAYRAWTKEWRVKYEVEQAKQTVTEDDPFPPEQGMSEGDR